MSRRLSDTGERVLNTGDPPPLHRVRAWRAREAGGEKGGWSPGGEGRRGGAERKRGSRKGLRRRKEAMQIPIRIVSLHEAGPVLHGILCST